MNNPPGVLGVRGARVLYKEKINAKRNRKAAIIIIVLNTNLYFNIFSGIFSFPGSWFTYKNIRERESSDLFKYVL